MKMRVHLLTVGGQFVGAWDSHFVYPPKVLIWGTRMFIRGGAPNERADDTEGPMRYFEASAFTIPDAHVEAEE